MIVLRTDQYRDDNQSDSREINHGCVVRARYDTIRGPLQICWEGDGLITVDGDGSRRETIVNNEILLLGRVVGVGELSGLSRETARAGE